MLRFPNPGSTLENFIKIFENLSNNLSNNIFNLDDMVLITVNNGLASSSGFIGNEAINQSTRKDRSRDPLYNQLKMYSELYRHLGWIKSTPDNSLNFLITPFGISVAKSKDKMHEFILSILCISFPNNSIATKSNFNIKPFFTILKIIKKIENIISRDELIICILSCPDDFGSKNINLIIESIKKLRNDKNIFTTLNKISLEKKIAVNTLKNYTRVPIMFLRDSGLLAKKDTYFYLTNLGHSYVKTIDDTFDLRLNEMLHLKKELFNPLNLEIYNNLFQKEKINKTILEVLKTEKKILFNPYQQLDVNKLSEIFKWNIDLPKYNSKSENNEIKNTNYESILTSKLTLTDNDNKIIQTDKSQIEFAEIRKLKNESELKKYTLEFCNNYKKSKQDTFYPIVQSLFDALGLKSVNSRYGVNYERWDSIIFHNKKIVPIEIKSPTEELHINIKSIRQALENKIILLSRYPDYADLNYTSLVVGYNKPNNRSDISKLIIDIEKTYNFRIGVIDFYTLAFSVFTSINKSKSIKINQILNLKGFLEI